jgi:hypothetical protein
MLSIGDEIGDDYLFKTGFFSNSIYLSSSEADVVSEYCPL